MAVIKLIYFRPNHAAKSVCESQEKTTKTNGKNHRNTYSENNKIHTNDYKTKFIT